MCPTNASKIGLSVFLREYFDGREGGQEATSSRLVVEDFDEEPIQKLLLLVGTQPGRIGRAGMLESKQKPANV